MISTKGRYAMRVMIDLAHYQGDSYIPMKEVATRQGISLKYLEQILPVLKKNKLVATAHGKGGGYRLTRSPSEYKIGEILRLTEGDLSAVACLSDDSEACPRAGECSTLVFWQGLNKAIDDYIDSYTLADLL